MSTRVGRYHLEERIGEGGMAEVYRATIEGADAFAKVVAIKRLKPGMDGHMLRTEAEIARSLHHGNLVQVFDYGTHEGTPYLVMEYVDGCSLTELIEEQRQRGESVETALVLDVVEQVAAALGYLHRLTDERGRPRCLAHRDVTPNNILISRDGVVKLTDLGIAKQVGVGAVTLPGHVQGTPHFASPEQITGRALDGRSDIFSLGMVCRYALGEPQDAALAGIIHRATEPAVDDRYTSAEAFRRVLLQWRLEHGIETDPAGLGRWVRRARGDVDTRKPVALDLGLSSSVEGMPEPLAVEDDPDPVASDDELEPPISGDVEPDDLRDTSDDVERSTSPLLDVGLARRPTSRWYWLPIAAVGVGLGLWMSVFRVDSHASSSGTKATPLGLSIQLSQMHVWKWRAFTVPTDWAIPQIASPGASSSVSAVAKRQSGTLKINVLPYAEVYVDGRKMGRTPLRLRLAASRHRVRLHNPQTGKETSFDVPIRPGGTAVVRSWKGL